MVHARHLLLHYFKCRTKLRHHTRHEVTSVRYVHIKRISKFLSQSKKALQPESNYSLVTLFATIYNWKEKCDGMGLTCTTLAPLGGPRYELGCL